MIENKLIDDNKVDKIMQLMSERIEVNETGYDEINENWTEQTEDDDEWVSEWVVYCFAINGNNTVL